MKSFIKISLACLLLSSAVTVFGQKGIDTQTQTIREGNNSGSKGSKATRTIDFGKDKTKVRDRLSNPYKFTAKKDILIRYITEVMREKRLILDETSSRLIDGILITQPFTFSKGAVLSTQELNRYGIVPTTQSNSWSRGRYILTVEIGSIDGTNHNVSVNAKVEGRTENLLGAEWITLRSSGEAEEEFLTKLVEAVTGVSPDEKPEEMPDDNR